MKQKIYLYISSIIILTLIFLAVSVSKIGFLSMHNDIGWVNDYLLLQDYVTTGKVYHGGTLSIDRYRELNQKYGNIFGYFEMPANAEGSLVSLKGTGRLFMKAPLFFMVGEQWFWGLWKVVSMICIGGAFLIHTRKGKKYDIIGFLLFLTLSSYFGFDLEFGALFVSIAGLIQYFNHQKNIYLILYFLFGLFASIVRTDFFLFFSLVNILLAFYYLYKKEYIMVGVIGVVSIFFLSTVMILNYRYYGGYFNFGYALQKESNNTVTNSAGITKIMSFFFPYGIQSAIIWKNIIYLFNGILGIGLTHLGICAFYKFINKKSIDIGFPQIIIGVIIFYGFILYGSNAYFYAPENRALSSYNRYFSLFIGLIWLILYTKFLYIKNILIIMIFLIMITMVSQQTLFYNYENQFRILNFLEKINSAVPKDGIVMNTSTGVMAFSGRNVLEPSGSEYNRYYDFLDGLITESTFLEKVINYLQDQNKKLYLVGKENKRMNSLIGFFLKKGFKISEIDSYQKIFLIEPVKRLNM